MKRIISILILSLLSAALFVEGGYAQVYQRSTSLVTIDGSGYYVHTVQKGETLYSLSRLYSVTENDIRKVNPHLSDGLQEGQVIKIPANLEDSSPKLSTRRQQRTFDIHYVNKGETLYAISRRYEIPVNTLLEDNPGLDPSQLSIGQGINIRKKSKGEATPEEIEGQINNYRDAINSLPTGFIYHIVERGETIFGISKMYDVTEKDILDNNNLPDGLKAGDMIKIPSREGQQPIVDIDLPQEPTSDGAAVWDAPGFSGGFEGGEVRSFAGAPKVALMLPLKNGEQASANFIEFYQGFLLGLEDLKKEGISANVSLYNTSRSSSLIYGITESEEFRGTNLIIGPVYEENMPPVLQYAGQTNIPVVSPLAPVSQTGSPLLYQMTPDRKNKYDKLKAVLAEDVNVIFISSSRYKDEEMENEIRPLLPQGMHTISLTGSMTAAQISGLLDRSRENLIFISCTNALAADQIMATVSSVQNNLVARSISGGGIKVVATPRWARFGSGVERDLYFKLNLCYVTNYHADRGNAVIRMFDGRFISAYGKVPSPYAYRGYDAAVLFIGSAGKGGNFNEVLNSGRIPLLQMSYRFTRSGNYGSMVNEEWALVCYHSDYTINVQ